MRGWQAVWSICQGGRRSLPSPRITTRVEHCRHISFIGSLTHITETVSMLFMVIEHFRGGDPTPVYTRFRERGRLASAGLTYINSWVTEDLTTCYQVMECADRAVLDQWSAAWSDLVDFEVIPVVTSEQATALVDSNTR